MSAEREPSAEIVAAFGQVMIVRHEAGRMGRTQARRDRRHGQGQRRHGDVARMSVKSGAIRAHELERAPFGVVTSLLKLS